MEGRIEEISIVDFDLSLSELRIVNKRRIHQIKKSMQAHGQLQPVVARAYEGGVQLIDGFKRVYACESLCIDNLQCRLLDVSEEQAKVLMLSYNWTTRSMDSYEEALVLRELLESQGVDQGSLARQTGRSRSWVSRRLSLIDRLDEGVGTEIRMGILSSSHGRSLMRLPRGNQLTVARLVCTYELSSRQTDRIVSAYLSAEDEQSRKLVLHNPERVLANPVTFWSLPEECYPDLSEYGNDLILGIHSLVESMQYLLSVLEYPKCAQLNKKEQSLLSYGLELLTDGAACLSERIGVVREELQKDSHNNER
jgi:ParB/RepB/Spo0J family partition protein